MKYEAILLDFYGTLVTEDDEIISRIVRAIARESPLKPTDLEVITAWRFSEWCAQSHGRTFRIQRDLEMASLREVLDIFESQLSPAILSESLYTYWRNPTAFPESSAFLYSLKVPTCLVSNIDRDDLHAAVAHNGWAFQHVVTSEDCRSYKPRPEMFEAAIKLLRLPPQRVMHVGDSLTADVRGAIAAGIPVAWINRRTRPRPQWAAPLVGEFCDLQALSQFLHQDE